MAKPKIKVKKKIKKVVVDGIAWADRTQYQAAGPVIDGHPEPIEDRLVAAPRIAPEAVQDYVIELQALCPVHRHYLHAAVTVGQR